jgi:hypothetical protein
MDGRQRPRYPGGAPHLYGFGGIGMGSLLVLLIATASRETEALVGS